MISEKTTCTTFTLIRLAQLHLVAAEGLVEITNKLLATDLQCFTPNHELLTVSNQQ